MANRGAGHGGDRGAAGRGGGRGNFNTGMGFNFQADSSSGSGGREEEQHRFSQAGGFVQRNQNYNQAHNNQSRGGYNGGFNPGTNHFNAGSGFNGNGNRQNFPGRTTGRFNNKGGYGRGRGRGVGRNFHGAAAVVPVVNHTPNQQRVASVDEQVTDAATALIPVANQLASSMQPGVADGAADDAKKQKKVDKPKCYRCGFTGHVLADCEVPICDCCESAEHVSEECPLLDAPKTQVMIYGHYHDDLTFFGMILTDSYKPKTENTRLAMVTVTGGVMTIPQIARHLQRVVPVDHYNWEIMQVGQNVYKVMFPSKAELDRLKLFGGFRVPNSVCELKVDAWHGRIEPMWQLPHVWVRMEGIPERHTGDFLALWGLGTFFGKTAKVDMDYTRKHKVLRIYIGCVDHTKIPKDLPLFIKDGFYNIRFVVEQPEEDEGDMEVDDGYDDKDDGHDDLDDDQSRGDDDKCNKKGEEGKLSEASVAKSVSSDKNSKNSTELQGTPKQCKRLETGVVFSPMVLKSFELTASSTDASRSNGTKEGSEVKSSNVARVLQAERILLHGGDFVASEEKVSDQRLTPGSTNLDTTKWCIQLSPMVKNSLVNVCPSPNDQTRKQLVEGGRTLGASPKVVRAVVLTQGPRSEAELGSAPTSTVLADDGLLAAAAKGPEFVSGAAQKHHRALPAAAGSMHAAAALSQILLPASAGREAASLPAYAANQALSLPDATEGSEDTEGFGVDSKEVVVRDTVPATEPLNFTDKEVIDFGGIASPSSRGIRSSGRIRSQPLADVHSMDRP